MYFLHVDKHDFSKYGRPYTTLSENKSNNYNKSKANYLKFKEALV